MSLAQATKRKKTSGDNHSRCKLHIDEQKILRTCNGFRKVDDTKCTAKIQKKVSDQYVARGHLPVCGNHKDQEFLLGHCEASASCGKKCGRPVEMSPGYNQLCEIHKDAPLVDHFSKLPAEVQHQIAEYLIPEGSVMLDNTKEDYRMATALLKTNPKLCSSTAYVYLHSWNRSCAVIVTPACISILGTGYVHDLHVGGPSSSATNQRHVVLLGQHSFGGFSNVHIVMDMSFVAQCHDGEFFSLLEMFRRTLDAVTQAHHVGKLEGVCIDLEFDYTDLQSFSANEVLVAVKIILKMLKMQDLGTCRLEWIISVYTSASNPNGSTTYHELELNYASRVQMYNPNFPKVEAGLFRVALVDLQAIMDSIPTPQDSSLHSVRWQAYKQIYVKCKTLEDLRIHYEVRLPRVPFPDDDDAISYPALDLCSFARIALFGKDDDMLGEVLGGVNYMLTQYSLLVYGMADMQIDQGLTIASLSQLRFAQSSVKIETQWPQALTAPPDFSSHTNVVIDDDVYEKYVDESTKTTKFRLLTPRVVRLNQSLSRTPSTAK